MDKIAKLSQAYQEALSGLDIWWLRDAAEDEDFENACTGVSISAADDALKAGGVWNDGRLAVYFRTLSNYLQTTLGLAAPFLDTYLISVGMRVPYEYAEAWRAVMGVAVTPRLVFPKGTYAATGALSALGMHRLGRLTGGASNPSYADVDGAIDTTKLIGAVILAHSVEASVGASNLVVTVTLQDATTKDVALTPSESANGQVVIGEQAITGVDGAVISVAATAQFKVGEWVMLWENADGDTSQREVGQVKAIVTNTSVELEAAPVNTFSASGYIIPMFTDITWKSGTLTQDKHLDFYAKPDRIIAQAS